MSAPDQIWPMGSAMPFPAMSGADPWTGSKRLGKRPSGLMLALGAIPIVPVQAGPRSERMSPKRLEATTTSKRSGCSTKFAVRMSMWYLSTSTPGNSSLMAATRSSQKGIVMAMPLDFVALVRWWAGRDAASSKA